jgi:hypothetical protein
MVCDGSCVSAVCLVSHIELYRSSVSVIISISVEEGT